ncbi:hypothetical protein P154DRAFT_518370 [Amniculicola lignicola CBS 123094]|uniref:Uncharacterized protein n=1 Tax=Amniculicola lignicola CBS 123094 TaxID=1392246 RepID=A0A6A5WZK0_9PLEO|nr:hypothetical protein P154DRAFT_518370 [Amniculicola lignicola CBS 123094]
MDLNPVLEFLLNPSAPTYSTSLSLYTYLQSSPITPLLDAYAVYLALILLTLDGLPISKIRTVLPHLLNRREQNHADPLHSSTSSARLRPFFAVLWTTSLLFYSSPHSSKITLKHCIVSLILLSAPFLATKVAATGSWQELKDFNNVLETYNIDPERVDGLYKWIANAAIWIHCYILVEPVAQLLLVDVWFHPGFAVWNFVQWYGSRSVGILVIGLLTVGVSFLCFALLERCRPTYDGGGRHVIVSGMVGSVVYGLLMGAMLVSTFSTSVWGMSDVLFWAADQGLKEYQMLMSRDDFGTYLHSEQCRKDREERERREKEKERKIREGTEFKEWVKGLDEEDRAFLREDGGAGDVAEHEEVVETYPHSIS